MRQANWMVCVAMGVGIRRNRDNRTHFKMGPVDLKNRDRGFATDTYPKVLPNFKVQIKGPVFIVDMIKKHPLIIDKNCKIL